MACSPSPTPARRRSRCASTACSRHEPACRSDHFKKPSVANWIHKIFITLTPSTHMKHLLPKAAGPAVVPLSLLTSSGQGVIITNSTVHRTRTSPANRFRLPRSLHADLAFIRHRVRQRPFVLLHCFLCTDEFSFRPSLQQLISQDSKKHHRAHNSEIERTGNPKQINQVL